MEKSELENLIRNIDKVIKSKSSRISKKDLEILVKIREGLRNSKTKRTLKKYLDMLLKLIGIASTLIDKFK